MKASEFHKIMHAFIVMMEADRSGKAVEACRAVCDLFDGHGGMSVVDLTKYARPSEELGSSWTGTTVGDLKKLLTHFHKLAALCAKKPFTDDLNNLISMLEGHEASSVQNFVEAAHDKLQKAQKKQTGKSAKPNKERIANFVSQLEASYKDEVRFYSVFNKLKNRSVSKAEAVEIAILFAVPLAKSTTKKKALEHIENVHTGYMGHVLKREAMKGRSAA